MTQATEMKSPVCTDYAMRTNDADYLKGVVGLPNDIRLLALQQFVKDEGSDALVSLFSQFIGMANSVVDNNREMIELYLITECGMHPHAREKMNLPTLFGALMGVVHANRARQRHLCHGCAFRLGSCANQSPVTTCDVEYSRAFGEMFWCHEETDADGKPTRKCRGHLSAYPTVEKSPECSGDTK